MKRRRESDPRWVCQSKRGTVQHGWWQRTEGSHCASQKSGEVRCREGQGIFVSKMWNFDHRIINALCQGGGGGKDGWEAQHSRCGFHGHFGFAWKDAPLRIQKRQAKMDLKCASTLKIGAIWSTMEHRCWRRHVLLLRAPWTSAEALSACSASQPPRWKQLRHDYADYAVVFLPKFKVFGEKSGQTERLKDWNCQNFRIKKKDKLTAYLHGWKSLRTYASVLCKHSGPRRVEAPQIGLCHMFSHGRVSPPSAVRTFDSSIRFGRSFALIAPFHRRSWT